jgi:hypothetical protein
VHLNWNGNFRSGSRYTPMIAGDVNGDGSSNDRAFIADPSSFTDPVAAATLRNLIAGSPCLSSQAGKIAERNSCTAPWSSTASLQVTLDRVKFHMPQRANVSFSLSNPIGAADILVNGSDKIKGWGMQVAPDPALFYVRGFDPSTNRYKYEVNQRFGATSPQLITLRNPVVLTVSLRFDLGATREWQRLEQALDAGRSLPGARQNEAAFRQQASAGIQNPMANIMRQQDSLDLTALQADSIASMNRDYLYRVDSLWTPVAHWFAALPAEYDSKEVHNRYLGARHAQIDMLVEMARAIQDLLTPAQKRMLPTQVLTSLDPLYLRSIRNGTGTYIGGGTDGGGGGGRGGGGGGGGGGGFRGGF